MRHLFFTVFLLFSFCGIAREYDNLTQYRAKTGKEVLSRKDWLTKDRKTSSRQWREACLYNFAYQGGHKEYNSLEERIDFYQWVSEYLASKGHEIKWPEAQVELNRYIKKTQRPTFDNDIRLFLKATQKVVFDTAFFFLQEVKNMEQSLTGLAAEKWDREMFAFEHTEIYQPLVVRMDRQSIDKLNRIMHRKGFAVFSLPIELKMKGKVEIAEDRIAWSENKLLPFVKGT
ncbi:MAG: hypothetical protein ACPF8V_03580, partial [Luteibaculum sp.]